MVFFEGRCFVLSSTKKYTETINALINYMIFCAVMEKFFRSVFFVKEHKVLEGIWTLTVMFFFL